MTWLIAHLPDSRSPSLPGAKIAASADTSWMREWLVPSRLTALIFLPVVVWNVIGVAVITPLQTAALDHGTWIAGSDTAGASAIYGTLGVAAAGNIPGARDAVAIWTPGDGNVWLFGGQGSDVVSPNTPQWNDLWKYPAQ